MSTQQTFNYRSLAGCIKAIKDSLYYGKLDNPEQIGYISFEIPSELVKLDRNQTVILDNLNSNPYIIDRSYKEVKAIAKNISHAFNFFVKYPGQEKLEVSWCWDFNAMHVIYCSEERERRFQEFMAAKKAKQVEQVTDTLQTKLNYKIKKTKDNLIIVTDGLEVHSLLSSKKELEQAIQNSLAHKWLVERATNKSKLAISHSNQLPITDSKDFLLTAFYTAVKVVVENLREIDELSISEAIEAGNSLIQCQKVISNSFVIHEQIKDALRYRTLAGI